MAGREESHDQMMVTVKGVPKASWRSLKSQASDEQLSATFETSGDDNPDSQEFKQKDAMLARRRQESITMFNFSRPELNVEEITTYMDENLYSVDFDIFYLQELTDGRPLYFLSLYLLEKYDLLSSFKIDEEKARSFFRSVERNYKPQPFHNSVHAADVLHVIHLLLLSDPSVAKNFTKFEILAAFIAAAVHDVDHPAVNNNFLIQSAHSLAILYNDISVLEYHHASRAFEITAKPEMNIFETLSGEDKKAMRKMIIGMVIATDLTKHFHYINTLKSKLATSSFNLEDPADRSLILDVAIKCSDLNNPTKSLEASKQWAFLVVEEFFNQ
ncbi:cAMP-specific 3',5'-cyclic phosphodiesterase 4D, partial [Irineochytrium annulatum]